MGVLIRKCTDEEIKSELIAFFKRKTLIPIVGAGFSCGVQSMTGQIPSGSEFKKHMLEVLKSNNLFNQSDLEKLNSLSFSDLCDHYEDDELVSPSTRRDYLKLNFSKTSFDDGDMRKRFFEIDWPYIYSLNIDDAIESSSDYNHVILPNREVQEEVFLEEKCLIKLHGDINELLTYTDGKKIFTSKEYAMSLEKNAHLLSKLRDDYANQNVLFIGCSLDDEVDIKTLSELPINYENKDRIRKTIVFIKGEPSVLRTSKFRTYGITDVVCFDDYDYMYKLLKEAWDESQQIDDTEIDRYEEIEEVNLTSRQTKENYKYFFWGKNLQDSKSLALTYPYFYISREVTKKIMFNFVKNTIHLIEGSRITGKSYVLAELYREIRDRRVYLFSGKSRLSDAAFQKLLTYRDSLILFDTGVLSRTQLELVLSSSQKARQNRSNYVICLNKNDNDTNGFINLKQELGVIKKTDYISYELSKKFTSAERGALNEKLPYLTLLPYNKDHSILDHLILNENELSKQGRFKRHKISVRRTSQLVLLLLLATREKIYSRDIIKFYLEKEIVEALNKYDPLIEKVESDNYEKDSKDLSSFKYVINSKYWLRRELGNFGANKDNYQMIADAYKYIITKINLDYVPSSRYPNSKRYKEFIMFDVMNDIFLQQDGGIINLIKYIYEQLQEILAGDFNFLHQYAKCLYNFCSISKNSRDSIIENYSRALDLATVSKSMIEQRYDETKSERLLISLAHVQLTIASIRCALCSLNGYTSEKDVEETIVVVLGALKLPYNNWSKQNPSQSAKIKKFVNELHIKLSKKELSINKIYIRDAEELINLVRDHSAEV